MNKPPSQPLPGHYRLVHNVRIVDQDEQALAICDYPLRIVQLNPGVARLLTLCADEHTCEQLALQMNMPLKRVEMLCDQLRWKGLLEVGPMLSLDTWPGISIVIPSYNRMRELERCLRSLFSLNYPAVCMEIIVVDDASSDDSCTMLQQLTHEAAEYGLRMQVLRHDQQRGVACSRNTGAESAHYDLIAYIDSDCVAAPAWLEELVPAFQDKRIAAVGGMIRAYVLDSLLGRYEDVRSSLFMGNRSLPVRLEGPLKYLPTANLLVRRAIWLQLGGFAPLAFGEDVDFCRRLLQTGAHMHYLAQGVVYHDYRTSPGAFLRTRISYASSEAALLQRHPSERRVLLLPPEQATFAAGIVGGIWGLIVAAYMASNNEQSHSRFKLTSWIGMLLMLLAFLTTLFGLRIRLQKIRAQRIPIGFLRVFSATVRAHLAYTYLLARHLTRYYTLPFLLVSVLLPPLLVLLCILYSIVISVDYVRLRPGMNLVEYVFCSFLDDCAYELGVIQGCIKHQTWLPLFPMVKKDM